MIVQIVNKPVSSPENKVYVSNILYKHYVQKSKNSNKRTNVSNCIFLPYQKCVNI